VQTSLFEIFKIGIGPSSSHTVGPMRAAAAFAVYLREAGLLGRTSRIEGHLYGSLALTGRGHGTDRAVLLGLSGELPDRIEPDTIDPKLAAIRSNRRLMLDGTKPLAFDEARDLVFHQDQTLSFHSNGMRFRASDAETNVLAEQVYYSIGGGFIVREGEAAGVNAKPPVKYPFSSAAELLAIGAEKGLTVWEIGFENEKAWHSEHEIRQYVGRIRGVMQASIERGLATEGILPGGLSVRRRAPRLAKKLIETGSGDPLAPMDWVNVYAMAVNEENAAGGRIVTAPTNGAAGIIPAVAEYYTRFVPGADDAGILRYFLTASVIGVLYKENASISGAEVGCQGEVGVACSMAAGALVAAQNGANGQVEYAAEIGMEHNLGMTCDPIGGLVQIPCIERNAMGAVKAINASRIALREGSEHKVSLDQVIETMYQTGMDMQSRYKETSLGGLALNVIEC